jgi:hypothetical protein
MNNVNVRGVLVMAAIAQVPRGIDRRDDENDGAIHSIVLITL